MLAVAWATALTGGAGGGGATRVARAINSIGMSSNVLGAEW